MEKSSIDIEKLKLKGNTEFKSGNFEKAIVHYTKAICNFQY